MFSRDLPSIKEIIVGDLAEIGRWVVANISGSIYWTMKVQEVQFRGRRIFILPPTREGNYPALASRLAADEDDSELRKTISGLLSSLCWIAGGGALVEFWSGGSRAHTMSGHNGRMVRTAEFELDYLPDPDDPKARLALALCREAGAVNLATYGVITYFRVLEIHHQGQSREVKDWITANLDRVRDHTTGEIIDRLSAQHADVGSYLYDSCRSAAAHGKLGKWLTLDPDDPADESRMRRDLPLARALAIRLTEDILGVETTYTNYKRHLYELQGFKAGFPESDIARMVAGEPLEDGKFYDIPDINIGLMGKRVFPSLSGLTCIALHSVDHGLFLAFESKNKLLTVELTLDFKEERLQFDIGSGLMLRDDGSVVAAEMAADVSEFTMLYWLNGRLRIEDAERNVLLARKDAFIPVNVIVRSEGFRAQIEQFKREAQRRAASRGRSWRASVPGSQITSTINV